MSNKATITNRMKLEEENRLNLEDLVAWEESSWYMYASNHDRDGKLLRLYVRVGAPLYQITRGASETVHLVTSNCREAISAFNDLVSYFPRYVPKNYGE